MGGGTSIWASPEWRSDPREIFNGKIYYLTASVAFAGCAYGFDQGNIGGVLTLKSESPSVVHRQSIAHINFLDNTQHQ